MDRVTLLSATIYTLFGLASVSTVGRVLSRWRRLAGEGFKWDDWTSFLSHVCAVGLTVAEYYQLANGLGQQSYLLDSQSLERFLLWRYISQHFYIAVVFGTKISLALLYLRAWPARSSFRTACSILASALVCAFVALEVVAIIQCLPIAYNWRLSPGASATCIDRRAYAFSLAGADTAFGVAVLLFPVSRLLKIDTNLPRKIGICAAFLVGLAAIAISAVRIVYLDRSTTDRNVTWHYSYLGLYSSIEAYLSQICCCIPTMAIALTRSINGASRLSNSSRKSASTSRSGDRGSGAVIGVKGIGPSDPDPEKAHFGDYPPSEGASERAPSPTIGLQSHRTWEEAMFSASQFPTHHVPSSSNPFQQPHSLVETPSVTSSEDLRDINEDEVSLAARSEVLPMGIPSIAQNNHRVSEPRPQSVRLSTDLVPFTTEARPSASRLDLHSW